MYSIKFSLLTAEPGWIFIFRAVAGFYAPATGWMIGSGMFADASEIF